MAATKLTLRLEETLIEQAKDFARSSGKSLSQVVSDYFLALARPAGLKRQSVGATPITESLAGCLRGAELTIEDYRRHLTEKYR